MWILKTAAAAVVLFGALAAPVQAGVFEDRLQIKLGVIGVLPDEGGETSIGGGPDISDEYVPSVQLEWFFGEHVSMELLCCVAPHEVKAVGTILNDVDLGEVTLFPPTLTVKYRWTNFGAIEPYVGAGVNYTHFFNEDLPAGGVVTDIAYDDSVGPALQVGADIRLNERWAINLDARKVWINTDVSINNGAVTADVDIDPWVISAGIGYRF